ncbi:MAG: amidohydrolase family protein [Bacteroidetes bacterium]|nr:amidohydrolase family protein [Bacteroidota bacterium]HOA38375.1 amidohydrolase family protein [Flavihumibacter sp.]
MANSRRKFLQTSTLAGIGAVLLPSLRTRPDFHKLAEDDRIIDIHQHSNYHGRTDEQMIVHQQEMGITYTILLPAGHPVSRGSTHYGISNGLYAQVTPNEAAWQFAQAHPKDYFFGTVEVPDLPTAITEMEKYLQLGAVAIGELKFNVDCDSTEMQRVYQLAQAFDVPVIMHWQYKMYNNGFDRFHKMVKKYPRVKFLGHAQTWWANIDRNNKDQNILYPKGMVTAGGYTERLLSDYPNVYGDLSAGSGLQALTRDDGFTRNFLSRHQNKLVYGSDCADAVGKTEACQGSQTIAAIKKFSASKDIERKLLFNNANQLFRLGR